MIGDILGAIKEGFEYVIYNTVYRLFYYAEIALCQIISVMQGLFKAFSGMETVSYGNSDSYLIDIFFGNRVINAVYWGMAIIGIILIFAFTIIAVVRKSFDLDGKQQRSHSQIIRAMLRGILVIISMNLIITISTMFTNGLMESVNLAFTNGELAADGQSHIDFNDEQYAAMSRIFNTVPGNIYIASGILAVGGLMLLRMDGKPIYVMFLGLLRFLAYPKLYKRSTTDKELLPEKEKDSGENESGNNNIRSPIIWSSSEKEKASENEASSESENAGDEAGSDNTKTEDDKSVSSEVSDSEKVSDGKASKGKKPSGKSKSSTSAGVQTSAKQKNKKEKDVKDVMPFTGIKDGFIEYAGKYYGTIIEIDSVEFRFFSQFRRDASIENCLGKIIRSLRSDLSANIIKIDRPILYNSYLHKEYEKLDSLRASYEKGMLTEEELQARIEIQYDRINALRKICYEEKVIQPFYYIALFNSHKKQLEIDTDNAITALQQGELTVRRLTKDRDLAIFLKYTNCLDFDEWDVDKLDPKDYMKWVMPESLSFTSRYVKINRIITHQMSVVSYPADVGDAWLAGVMSLPATKVMIKITPMERTKSIRAIDRSLQELRGQLNSTGVDSKRIEIEGHIETLSRLLVTLQQDNESLLTVNIYVSMYDALKTSEFGDKEAVKDTSLASIADMKKIVRRVWSETGMRLNGNDFAQLECFIASQVSAYDPFIKEGRGMPANTIAAMYPWIYAHVSDEGGIRLGNQDGVPVFIDFFRRDSERINSNMVIIGKSGSGKSYGTKSLLTNMASEDAKIFILDPENEYTELAHTLHGKIINVGNAVYGRLNPFHIITTIDDDDADSESVGSSYSAHLQFLEEFFKTILPDVDKEALEYLNSLVERLYTNFGITSETNLSKLKPDDYPIFDDLYDLVLEDFQRNKNEYLRKLLQTLMNYVSKFSSGGRNSNIWNGPSTITTEENFSVFNFQSLLANRNSTIANAQMMLVLKYIDNEIIKNRDFNMKFGLKRKIVVVIDEAHVFIDTKYPIALDFMFQLAKRIRKYNGMQIVITQNIKDFVGSEEIARKSTAIINACQYSFIFSLAPNDMDDLCKLYEKAGGINEMEQDQIVTAPRGMAFTIMSPTSRSSFMVEVPQTMVDMFEQPDYQTHYFSGEEGLGYWEDFVARSRDEHEKNKGNRDSFGHDAGEKESNRQTFFFTEISPEEAETISKEYRQKQNAASQFRRPKNLPEERSFQSREEEDGEPFVFSEVSKPETGSDLSTPKASEVRPMQPVQPVIDYEKIIAAIRSEVRREMELQLAAKQIQSPAATQTTASELPEKEKEESPVEKLEPASYSAPGLGGGRVRKEEPAKAPEPEPEPEEELSDDQDVSSVFDIMSLLDEQLESYSEMGLEERMEEIDVETMEISFDELVTFIKDQRKKRGA